MLTHPLIRTFARKIRNITYRAIDLFLPSVTNRNYLGFKLFYSSGNGLVERLRFLSPKKTYEPELGKIIIDALAKKPEGTFVDIGSNIGLISLYVHKFSPRTKIVCFEPGQLQRALFELTIAFNNLSSNIQSLPYAIAEKNYLGIFSSNSNHAANSGDGLLNTNRTLTPTNQVSVDIRTLDGLVSYYQFQPSVIKIDIEGAELLALKGMVDTLKKFRPVVFFEMNPQNLAVYPYEATDIISFFHQNNYKIKNLDGEICSSATYANLAKTDDMFIAEPTNDDNT